MVIAAGKLQRVDNCVVVVADRCDYRGERERKRERGEKETERALARAPKRVSLPFLFASPLSLSPLSKGGREGGKERSRI